MSIINGRRFRAPPDRSTAGENTEPPDAHIQKELWHTVEQHALTVPWERQRVPVWAERAVVVSVVSSRVEDLPKCDVVCSVTGGDIGHNGRSDIGCLRRPLTRGGTDCTGPEHVGPRTSCKLCSFRLTHRRVYS